MRDTIGRVVTRGRTVIERHARELGSDLLDVVRGESSGGVSRRSYEAASSGRRLSGMRANGSDGNAELAADGPSMRNRSRLIERDSPFGLKVLREFATDQVGTGIRPQFQTGKDKTDRQLADDWEEWSYQVDPVSGGTVYGLQHQSVMSFGRDGGTLCQKLWRKPGDLDNLGRRLIVPLQIQALEVDYLSTRRDGDLGEGKGHIANGTKFDARGRRMGYYVRRAHPGASWMMGGSSASLDDEFVSAAEMLHIFEYSTARPGQIMAAPLLHAVIARLWDFDGWVDNTMLARRTAASIAAFVHGGDPTAAPDSVDGIAPAVGAGGTKAHVLDGHGYPVELVESGIVSYLPNGKEISFPEQPAIPGHEETIRVTLREIAAGTGMNYEGLSGDMSQGSFIAQRLGLLMRRRWMDSIRSHVTIPMLCRPMGYWFLDAEELAGRFRPGRDPVKTLWIPPCIEDQDELTRVKTIAAKIRAGLLTWTQAVMGEGVDPEMLAEEMRRSYRLLDGDGTAESTPIILDSDPRRQTAAGQPTSQPKPPAKPGN